MFLDVDGSYEASGIYDGVPMNLPTRNSWPFIWIELAENLNFIVFRVHLSIRVAAMFFSGHLPGSGCAHSGSWCLGISVQNKSPLMGNFFASKTCSNMQISLKFIHLTLFQTFFSWIFQSCSFQVHNYPAKSLATAHGSVSNHPSGHFSFQAKWANRYTAWNSAHQEDFPLLPSFTDIQKEAAVLKLSTFRGIPACCVELSRKQVLVFSFSVSGS